ncbi:MAG: TerB family tellurite resistance protein [Alphaproteobacteria bacterium]|nr:TerB family tellurite resistance protein [Alphaproteobacteria bacterium]
MNDIQSSRPRMTYPRGARNAFFYEFPVHPNLRSLFALSVIVLGAKLAKADGAVTPDKVLAFRRAFKSHNIHMAEIGKMFDNARQSAEGYEPYAARLAQIFGQQRQLLEQVMIGLFEVAIADSPRLTRPEILFLRRVGVIFGFDEETFLHLAAMAGISLSSTAPVPKRDTAFDILGLPTTATDDVIKRTYRALVRKHHPDKLVAAGLPVTRINEATEKIKIINAAYAEICKMRKIK